MTKDHRTNGADGSKRPLDFPRLLKQPSHCLPMVGSTGCVCCRHIPAPGPLYSLSLHWVLTRYTLLYECPIRGRGAAKILSHSPDIAGGRKSSARQEHVVGGTWVRAGDARPLGAVPLLDKAPPKGNTHGPDTSRGDRGDPKKESGTGVRICTWGQLPRRAIPVLDQGVVHIALARCNLLIADGPDVAGGDGCYAEKLIVFRPLVGAGDDRPDPALRERQRGGPE